MAFKKAQKKDARLRLALAGPSNSGKTLTALLLATHIARKVGKGRVAVIDSERGRSRMYAGYPLPDGTELEFDVDAKLPNFSPESYVAALRVAEKEGYDVVVVDSLSHEWAGTGGILEKVDNAAAGGNKWAGWRVGTPAHQAFLDAMLSLPMHVIGTMRSKTEWVLEDVAGKKVPKAIGTAPVQREGIEYEWDFFGVIDREHRLTVNKTTVLGLPDGKVFPLPGEDLADVFVNWLQTKAQAVVDEPEPVKVAPPAPPVKVAPPAPPAKEEIPATSAAPATASTDMSPSAAGPSDTAPAPEPTETVAQSFARQMREATTQAALDGTAAPIGAALASGRVTSVERTDLVKLYIARSSELRAPKSAEKAA